jgi:hypothetical protein
MQNSGNNQIMKRREIMPKKIHITFLFTVLIAIVALFAATQPAAANGSLGDGNCDSSEAALFQCFENAGYVVEILPCNGQFPCIITPSGDSDFRYRITEIGSDLIRYINLLIPAAPELEILSSTPPNRMLFTAPQGDKTSKFGRGLTLYNTVRLDKYDGRSGDISLTLRGRVPAVHNAMGLIAHSSDYRRWGTGEILVPGGLPQENEPVSAGTLFSGAEFDWRLLYDAAGNSNDAECVPTEDCTVTTLLVNQIPFGVGLLDSLPIDEPFVASSSPGCTYVRTRSGGVKKICN